MSDRRSWCIASSIHSGPATSERCCEVVQSAARDFINGSVIRRYAADDLLTVAVIPQDDFGTVVVSVSGDVDHLSAPVLSAALSGCLKADCRRVVVDLTAVTFLNAAGLAVIADFRRRTDAQRTVLAVHSKSALVARQLTLIGRLAGRTIDLTG